MQEHILTSQHIEEYVYCLQREERAAGTVEKYRRDVTAFYRWLRGREVTRETAALWKEQLRSDGYSPVTINSMLAAVNGLFRFLDWTDCRLKFLRIQRRVFRESGRELDRGDYARLLAAAEGEGRTRLALLMETICATGIRVSEVRYITVEALRQRRAEVSLKGKIRTILLPGRLVKKLLRYAKKEGITTGELFRTKTGRSLSRRQIWAEMKSLCKAAGVEPDKVFPHNLRHLFARCYYAVCRDVIRLADILGHSSVETTRIYLISTEKESAAQIERLGLVT